MSKLSNPTDNYTRLTNYSLMLSALGGCFVLLLFPAGVFYGFFFGVLGVSGGILSKPYTNKKGRATAAILIGAIVIMVCFLAFHGLTTLYTSLKDPVAGPIITEYVMGMLEQYGVSAETFVTIMHP